MTPHAPDPDHLPLREEAASPGALPLAPSLGISLEAANMPRRANLVEPRVLFITGLAIVLGVAAGFIARLLVVVSVLPRLSGMSGDFYLGGALVLGAVFLWHAWKLMDPPDEFYAMRVFNFSIVYLMALFAFLLIDHWLLPWLQPVPAFVLQPAA